MPSLVKKKKIISLLSQSKLTKIKWTLTTGYIVVDVGNTKGVDSCLAHTNSKQRHQERDQDVRDDFTLSLLFSDEVTLAVLDCVRTMDSRHAKTVNKK